MANPHIIARPEVCASCKRMCRVGEAKYGHAEKGSPVQRWYCVACAGHLNLICLKQNCKRKKNPEWSFCWDCGRALKQQMEAKNEEGENEFEKELKKFEEEEEKKKLEEELKKKEEKKEKEFTEEITTTCLSIGCQERRSVCCDSYSAEMPISGLFVCRKCGEEFKSKPCNARSKVPLNVAFDVDDVLWKIREDRKGQCPDYDMISVLKWFVNNGDNVYVWSAGGVDYVKQIVWKLGLDHLVTVIPKGKLNERHPDNPLMDLSFDDCEVNLARVDVNVRRPDYSKEVKRAYDDINEGLKKIGY